MQRLLGELQYLLDFAQPLLYRLRRFRSHQHFANRRTRAQQSKLTPYGLTVEPQRFTSAQQQQRQQSQNATSRGALHNAKICAQIG